MSIFLEITIIISFWVSLVMAWKITLYEMNVNNSPNWWKKTRDKTWGGFIYIVCATGVVLPLIGLFFME